MKCVRIILVITILFLVGCEYESPLTKEHTISIDSSILGVWGLDQEKEMPGPYERMLILKYSDTEYLIQAPMDKSSLVYFRGYPIKIGNVSCVQLEIIGTQDGPPPKDEKKLFLVVSYVLAKGELEVKLLNTKLVSNGLKDSEALRKAFLKHQGNKDLFIEPGKFRRIQE